MMEEKVCWIESLENSAERWADENMKDDSFKCSCGRWESNDHMNFISPNPYYPPVCGECFDKYCDAAR